MTYVSADLMPLRKPNPLFLVGALVAALASSAVAAPTAEAHDHSLGFGYRYGHLVTGADQVYDFHSPTIQYVGSVGSWLRFFTSIEIMIPMVGIQDGVSYDLNSTYESKFGTDISFGGALHFEPLPDMVVQTGLGPHMNAMTLSHAEKVTFNSLTLGITSYSTARYAITEGIETGVNILFSVDFADPIHTASGLSWGIHFAATAIIGVRLGEGVAPTLGPTLRDDPVRRSGDPEPGADADDAPPAGDPVADSAAEPMDDPTDPHAEDPADITSSDDTAAPAEATAAPDPSSENAEDGNASAGERPEGEQ